MADDRTDLRTGAGADPAASPRLGFVQCLHPGGLHRMAYWEWGDPANPRVVLCVHGLSRQGRDFDALARMLAPDFRVVCPDVAGRGRSDRLPDASLYQVPVYVADMVTLLARLDARHLQWVGTSMGGLIGLGVAALAGTPVERLVLNDIGPTIEYASVRRIGAYLGEPRRFAGVGEAAAFLRTISAGFGPHSDDEWLALTEPMLRPADDGDGLVLHYDPAIALPFRAITPEAAQAGEARLWQAWDAVRCPVLLLRGAESDLLSRDTARAMTRRGPPTELREFEGVGHAPTLVAPDQRAAVAEFLRGPP